MHPNTLRWFKLIFPSVHIFSEMPSSNPNALLLTLSQARDAAINKLAAKRTLATSLHFTPPLPSDSLPAEGKSLHFTPLIINGLRGSCAQRPPLVPPRSYPADKLKKILGPLAIFTYFLSLPVIAFGTWLLATREYQCEDLLRMPAMRRGIGVGLLLLFVISNVVVYHGRRVLVLGHTVLSIALVVMLTMGLSLVGTYKMEARGVPASPMWLRERVARADIWNNVKAMPLRRQDMRRIDQQHHPANLKHLTFSTVFCLSSQPSFMLRSFYYREVPFDATLFTKSLEP